METVKRSRHKWTKQEIEFLCNNIEKEPNVIAKIIGLGELSVKAMRNKLLRGEKLVRGYEHVCTRLPDGIDFEKLHNPANNKMAWRRKEDNFLRENINENPLVLAYALDRSPSAVFGRICHLTKNAKKTKKIEINREVGLFKKSYSFASPLSKKEKVNDKKKEVKRRKKSPSGISIKILWGLINIEKH